jgi:hypothetical protein
VCVHQERAFPAEPAMLSRPAFALSLSLSLSLSFFLFFSLFLSFFFFRDASAWRITLTDNGAD